MSKTCEHCAEPLHCSASELRNGNRTTRRRFCNHWCAAQWKNREHRVTLICDVCGKSFVRAASHRSVRTFCSQECYLQAHARRPLRCAACGQEFYTANYSALKYCSVKCRPPQAGPTNPNFGKRHPHLFRHTPEFVLRMSQARMGAGNPNYAGGATAYRYRFQTRLSKWGLAVLGPTCELCGADGATVHHIVARRLFSEIVMANFAQNLVMLCRSCHCSADHRARQALRDKAPDHIPFVDRLPRSIREQLVRDGSVSRLDRACDYAPIGDIASSVILPQWYGDTP